MDYRDQLSRLFTIRIADGAPLQRIREEFADGIHGLLVGADLRRLGILLALCCIPESPMPSNYPPGLMTRPDGTDFDIEYALDPMYKVWLSRDLGIASLRTGIREQQLLGAFAGWHYVDLCEMLDGAAGLKDLAAVDQLLQRIHLAILRGSERTMDQHIEDTLGEADSSGSRNSGRNPDRLLSGVGRARRRIASSPFKSASHSRRKSGFDPTRPEGRFGNCRSGPAGYTS